MGGEGGDLTGLLLGGCSCLPVGWGLLSCLRLQLLRPLGSSLASNCPLDTVPTAVFISSIVSTVKIRFLPAAHCVARFAHCLFFHLCLGFKPQRAWAPEEHPRRVLETQERALPDMPCDRGEATPLPSRSPRALVPSRPEEPLKSKCLPAEFYF